MFMDAFLLWFLEVFMESSIMPNVSLIRLNVSLKCVDTISSFGPQKGKAYVGKGKYEVVMEESEIIV